MKTILLISIVVENTYDYGFFNISVKYSYFINQER